jgi:hypothetical protein
MKSLNKASPLEVLAEVLLVKQVRVARRLQEETGEDIDSKISNQAAEQTIVKTTGGVIATQTGEKARLTREEEESETETLKTVKIKTTRK